MHLRLRLRLRIAVVGVLLPSFMLVDSYRPHVVPTFPLLETSACETDHSSLNPGVAVLGAHLLADPVLPDGDSLWSVGMNTVLRPVL